MRKLASLTMAGAMALAAAGLATSANAAINFVGVDTITAYPNGGPNTNGGLGIAITDPTDLSFFLTNVGDETGYISLFGIYTPEGSIEGDDATDRPLNLSFNFSAPAPGASGGLGGVTDAGFSGILSQGRLNWTNDFTVLNFASGYQLRVTLEDDFETFNTSIFGDLNEGPGGAADVRAKFKLLAVPTGVPEPATWGMMIMGFGMAGALVRRRRSAATFA